MELNSYHEASEWPPRAGEARTREDVLITTEIRGKKTVFLTDGLGNVLLDDEVSYKLYQEHLTQEEDRFRQSALSMNGNISDVEQEK